MNKKILAAVTAGFLTLALAQPASAATSGGSCTSVGATTKIGKNTYVCQKNPYFNKTKLTWVWDGCWELATEYATEFTTTSNIIKSAESDRLKIVQPALNSVNSLLKWSALVNYPKGSIVFGNNNYYTAVKANLNKGLTASNIGSTKTWKIYRPTYAKSTIGQAPVPQVALDMADKYVTALALSSSKTSVVATKLKYDNLVIQLNAEKTTLSSIKGDIDLIVNQLDDSIDTTKATLNLLEMYKSEMIKKCNPKY